MATLTKQAASETVNINIDDYDVAAASGGDVFINDGKTLFVVNNTGASACVVTITAQKTSQTIPGKGPMTKANGGGTVPLGKVGIFGPLSQEMFNNSSGQVAVTYDQVSGVLVAPLGTTI